MITPGSTVDWIMGATMLGMVVAFASAALRWMPDEPQPAERPQPWGELRELQVREHIARSATTASR
jgi:hypothetical protein